MSSNTPSKRPNKNNNDKTPSMTGPAAPEAERSFLRRLADRFSPSRLVARRCRPTSRVDRMVRNVHNTLRPLAGTMGRWRLPEPGHVQADEQFLARRARLAANGGEEAAAQWQQRQAEVQQQEATSAAQAEAQEAQEARRRAQERRSAHDPGRPISYDRLMQMMKDEHDQRRGLVRRLEGLLDNVEGTVERFAPGRLDELHDELLRQLEDEGWLRAAKRRLEKQQCEEKETSSLEDI